MRHTPTMPRHLVFLLSICFFAAKASHFYGGTISWRRSGQNNNYDVSFAWRQGWRRGLGICGTSAVPCVPNKINTFATNSQGDIKCSKGCGNSAVTLVPTHYWVTGVNIPEDWEQGINTFSYTFPGNGNYEVSFAGAAWMNALVIGGGTSWSVLTTIDLSIRSDTGVSNASPITSSRPIYRLAWNSTHTIKIPVLDPDFDKVLCRWATQTNGVNECAGVCNALPSQDLDPETCNLHLNLTTQYGFAVNSWYAVAIQIEDFPLTQITFGATTKTPSDPLSSIPLQFLIYTPILQGDAIPFFTNPTPAEGTVFYVPPNGTFAKVLQATNTYPNISAITEIYLIGPYGVMRTPLANASNQDESFIAITWTPTPEQYGVNLLCSYAENTLGVLSKDRCFVVRAGEYEPCDPLLNPCVYGTCDDTTGRAVCVCVPSYAGEHCDQHTDPPEGEEEDWIWILVGVLGAVALIAIIAAIACCCCCGAAARRRRKKKEEEEELNPNMKKRMQAAKAKAGGVAGMTAAGGAAAAANIASDYRPSQGHSGKHTKRHKHQQSEPHHKDKKKDRHRDKRDHSRSHKHHAVGPNPVYLEYASPNPVVVDVVAGPPPQAMNPVQVVRQDTGEWVAVWDNPVSPTGVNVGYW